MVDLTIGARPDERFHLQHGAPFPRCWTFGPIRRTAWGHLFHADGRAGWFVSWWCWKLQWYHGTVKCDGSRTYMYQHKQLGEPVDPEGYVMTTTPSELSAFRWRTGGPGDTLWNNMGGC